MSDRRTTASGSEPGVTPPGRIWRHPVHFLSFGLGSGLAPWAPGTAGTVAAVPLYLLLEGVSVPVYLAAVGLLFAVGVALCGATSKVLGLHDHPAIVWDEIVGYLLTMTAAPAHWWAVIAGFLLFRLFDIAKPWPIRWIDTRVQGGVGIMLDDVLAGAFAWVSLQVAVVALA